MNLTSAQAVAAYAKGCVSVTAGAGTGKTHMLAERYLHHLKTDVSSPLQMVTLTFTDKAATEMRSRIRQTVTEKLRDRPDVIAELEAAPISTFHALAARICREHPEAAHVPADFVLQDELEARLWQLEMLALAMEQLPIEYFEQVPYSFLYSVMESFLSDPLSAENALKMNQDDWFPQLETTRELALTQLLSNPSWNESVAILSTYQGQVSDKLETMRQNAIEAIGQVALPEKTKIALQAMSDLKINVGSKKNWSSSEALDAVKAAIRTLRQLAEDSLKEGLTTLELNWADERTEQILPILRAAFQQVRSHLHQEKQKQRVLDFTDLEVHALEALKNPQVCHYYAKRWQVFLIDEFQDTNPVQGKLIEALTQNSILTIVGDAKQSIYAFRRADVALFENWTHRIEATGGEWVTLDRSFRTHRSLMDSINEIFAPVLGRHHQNLEAERTESPCPDSHLRVYAIEEADKTTVEQRRFVEAQHIADVIEKMITDHTQVYDKQAKKLRPVCPGDIAILSRTWEPLEGYGQALAQKGIPFIQTGSGSLLQTREAKDGFALLQFLADPMDNLALVAVLRSPFFAVSDRTLFQLSQSLSEHTPWWQQMKLGEISELAVPVKVLAQLLYERQIEPPSRLLQIMDQLTGYTAVIANLAGCDRRGADWRGMIDFVRQLEQGNNEVLNVVRRLKLLVANEVNIPRPALASGDAVSLMTIHAAKGLEWSVVIVADLSRNNSVTSTKIHFEPDLGIGLKLADETGEFQASALFTLFDRQQKELQNEEAKRLMYVALTRSRDYLILSSAGGKGGNFSLLQSGLAEKYPIQVVPFDPDRALPPEVIAPPLPLPPKLLLHTLGLGLAELSVTAFTEYDQCPQSFKLRYVDGHPGMTTGMPSTFAAEVGTLTHKALEHQIQSEADLVLLNRSLNLGLPEVCVQDAWNLVQKFRQQSVYVEYQEGQWEESIRLQVGDIIWNGRIDLLGNNFVLDIKTDQEIDPEHHRLQLWAYAKATGRNRVHLAYLRHDEVHTFGAAELEKIGQEAVAIAHAISRADFQPTPSERKCGRCLYSEVCESRALGL